MFISSVKKQFIHHINAKIRAWSSAPIFQGVPTHEAHTLLDKRVVPALIKHVDDIIVPAADELAPTLRQRWQAISTSQLAPMRPMLVMPD